MNLTNTKIDLRNTLLLKFKKNNTVFEIKFPDFPSLLKIPWLPPRLEFFSPFSQVFQSMWEPWLVLKYTGCQIWTSSTYFETLPCKRRLLPLEGYIDAETIGEMFVTNNLISFHQLQVSCFQFSSFFTFFVRYQEVSTDLKVFLSE